MKNADTQNLDGFVREAHNVSAPSLEAPLMVEAVRGLKPRSVLDVGTGTGYIAIGCAKAGASVVVATDINPHAVEVATANAKRCNVDVQVFQSDLLDNVSGSFDVVVFNPPLVPSTIGTETRKMANVLRRSEWLLIPLMRILEFRYRDLRLGLVRRLFDDLRRAGNRCHVVLFVSPSEIRALQRLYPEVSVTRSGDAAHGWPITIWGIEPAH